MTLRRLDHLSELLAGSPHNLVSRRDRAQLRAVHVEECLAVGELLPLAAGQRWLDLGTGGGLPGLVLALRDPEVSWTLVDSARKKVEAVQGFAQALELTNVLAVWERAETLARDPGHRGGYDGVISRAVAPLPTLLELSRGFLRDGGTLAAVKGPGVEKELTRAAVAGRQLQLGDVGLQTVPSTSRPTLLVTMRARGGPPSACPRRDGVPRSNPLGGDAT